MKMSDWLDVLRAECERSGQGHVARRIGYSRSAVNQVLKNCYLGRIDSIEAAVRKHLLPPVVDCPILGTITGETCLTWRVKELASTSSFRVKMWQACRKCPHNLCAAGPESQPRALPKIRNKA